MFKQDYRKSYTHLSAAATVGVILARTAPATRPWLEKLLSPGDYKEKILLVDDDPTERRLIQHIIEQEGYRVRTADNGLKCLSLAKTFRPDLILLNVMMPIMDGWTALMHLKSDPIISYLKVIIHSLNMSRRDEDLSKELGAIDTLNIPFEPKDLLIAVERALRC